MPDAPQPKQGESGRWTGMPQVTRGFRRPPVAQPGAALGRP
ncbi:hypothetical protein [Azospirillum palustre]